MNPAPFRWGVNVSDVGEETLLFGTSDAEKVWAVLSIPSTLRSLFNCSSGSDLLLLIRYSGGTAGLRMV